MKIKEMTDEEFMRLMQAAHRAQIKEIQERLDRERKACLWITRARDIALDPAAATPEENAQIARCPHCARLIERVRASLQGGGPPRLIVPSLPAVAPLDSPLPL